jgi:hypothetical protein
MNGITLSMQQPSHLISAELDPGHFRQVGSKSGCRPSREAVTELQGVRSNGFLHGGQKFRRRSAGPPWGFDRPQSVDPSGAVQASHTLDRIGRATHSLRDRRDGISGVGHQDDQAVPKDVGRTGRESKVVELIEFFVAELDPASQGSLLATGLPGEQPRTPNGRIESFCVSS